MSWIPLNSVVLFPKAGIVFIISFTYVFILVGSILLQPEDTSTAWISYSITVWMSQLRMPRVRILLYMFLYSADIVDFFWIH